MGFLILGICSSAMISILMRASAGRTKSDLSVLAANYFFCMILGAVYAGFELFVPEAEGAYTAVGLGAVNGVLLLGGFLMLQRNTRINGIVLSSIFMKLGLLVPIAASVLLFHETPTALQAVGFCLAIGAIVLINLKKGERSGGIGIGLILLLLFGGSADTMAKVYEVYGNYALTGQFLFYSFSVAFLLCLLLVLVRKERPDGRSLLFGLLMGIPNFFCSKFLLGALESLEAVVVYPTFSVATMLLVTLSGVVVFREKLGRHQWAALAIIVAALILLNI